jgi:hypothetical protein
MSREDLYQIAKTASDIREANKHKSLERYLDNAHPGQDEFHHVKKRVRFFLGGNRTGKSTSGVIEDLWSALGLHPYRQVKTPNKGLIVIQDFENHGKLILEPKMREWAPPGAIKDIEKNQNGAWRRIVLNSGTPIDIMSHDQALKAFEGGDWDWAHFDEPPPQNIFTAVWRGLTDRGGLAWITATPIVAPWMYKEVKQALDGNDPLRWARYVAMEENARNIGEGDEKLGLKRIGEFLEMLPPEEREARRSGTFLHLFGLILKEFRRQHHVIPPFPIPIHWPIWESIDPHPRKPWGVSWTAMTPNSRKILIRSGLYEGDVTEVANQILYERAQLQIEGGRPARITRCLIDNYASAPLMQKSNTDPTARRVSIRSSLEALIGPLHKGPTVEVAPKNVTQKIDLFRAALRIVETKDGPRSDFYVFDIPENERFIYEIENYIWDKKRGGLDQGLKDVPLKKDDDILDTVMQVFLTAPQSPGPATSKPAPTNLYNTKRYRM